MCEDDDAKWKDLGSKFQEFRLDRVDETPSEWNVPLFALRQSWCDLRGVLGGGERGKRKIEENSAA